MKRKAGPERTGQPAAADPMRAHSDVEHAVRLLGAAQGHLDRCGLLLAAVKVQEAIDCLRLSVEQPGGHKDV